MRLQELDFAGKRVLVRVDFNVPLNNEKEITDDTRIRKAIPTLQYILDQGGSLILMSHLGRPQKKLTPEGEIDVEKFSLYPLVGKISAYLNRPVFFSRDCGGDSSRRKAESLQPGQVLLIENTRFTKDEKNGDEEFAKRLASLGDIYVNDAFGTAHRAHASTTTIAQFFAPENKAFGKLMAAEIENASRLLETPTQPVTAILGGAKVSDKIQLIEKLMEFADNILIGGGMSYTFVKANGGAIGNSLVEEEYIELAKKLQQKAAATSTTLFLPEDSVIADSFSADAQTKVVSSKEIPDGWMGLDIGPRAIETYQKVLAESKTILWNGPVGVFEMEAFAKGSLAMAKGISHATSNGAFSIVGGGDSVSAVNQSGLADTISFVSTGGGAMLEFLEGKALPGIEAMKA